MWMICVIQTKTETMRHGKEICRQLKQLRRDIADQNGIELEIPECTYEGECSGTCPRCDYELRYLENELARRQRLGKAAVVAGTVLTMASFQTAVAQEPVRPDKPDSLQNVSATGVLKGCVTDEKTDEPLMACNVVLRQNGEIVTGARTDWDGCYTIKGLATGSYDVELSYMGYKKYVIRNVHIKQSGFTVLNRSLSRDPNCKLETINVAPAVMGIIAEPPIEIGSPDTARTPVIEIETDGNGEATGKYTIGGVQVQLNGTPANESGEPLPKSQFKLDNGSNPLDNK